VTAVRPLRMLRLYHLARADFLERVRRYSFLILVGLTVYLGYLFVPPVDAAYQTVSLGDARGVYNSAWMGAMYGLMISSLVTLIAFYPIKNTVTRDRETRVGQIIAATPVRKASYALGKWLSNLALLTLLLGVMTVMAVVMQWVRAEDLRLDLAALVVPLWLIAFPALSLAAAMAVLFECTPVLRGAAGNVIYIIVYVAVLVASIEGADGIVMKAVNDPFGIAYVISDMQRTLLPLDPDYDGQVAIGGAALSADPLFFGWDGMVWSGAMVAARLSWVGVAFLLALLAALPFDRFDPARQRLRRRAERQASDVTSLPPLSPPRTDHGGEEERPAGASALSPSPAALTAGADLSSPSPACLAGPVFCTGAGRGGGRVLLAELRLSLKGRRWWWYAVLAGLNVAGLAVPDATVYTYLFAAAWFWPITLWSALGSRERQHDTQQIVFSVPRPVGRQLAGAWLAGVCLTALAGAGFALQRAFTGQWDALAAWAVGALFIPSLALALGVWSGGPRAFEIVYTFLWYIGPINGVSALDYMGVTAGGLTGHVSLIYLLATVVLLGLAVLGRRRQVQW